MFARAPLPGRCKTRLAAVIGAAPAAELYEALLRDTIANLSRVTDTRRILLAAPENGGVDILQSYANADWEVMAQHPGDLSARLIDVFERLGGDGPVICVGSDAPMVPIDALQIALADDVHDVVVGPSRDGGYWAIGMRGLHRDLFRAMPWSTDGVTRETLGRCQRLGLTVRLLPESFDVDEAADMKLLEDAVARRPERAPHTAAWLRAARG